MVPTIAAVIAVPRCLRYRTLAALVLCAILAGCHSTTKTPPLTADTPWPILVEKARNTEVAFGMWNGEEIRNRLFREEITNYLHATFGITLRIVPLAATAEAVNKLLSEKAAGKNSGGALDFVWINSENFRTAKQAGLLWGPFAGQLPSLNLYDDSVRQRDFGTPIDGMEAPWHKSQFVLAYDSARVPTPPTSIPDLEAWIKAHPGRFTYIAPPDATGSAFIRHLLLYYGQRDPKFWTGFDEVLYHRASTEAFRHLKELKPFLWRRGETYPASLQELYRLFGNREVDFAMSYGPAFASLHIARGDFPATTRTFVFNEGTLGNYSFLAIPFNASNPAGAMVVINELMSLDVMLTLSASLDELFPFKLDALNSVQRERIAALHRGPATLPLDVLEKHYLPEPDAEYLKRFNKDWQVKVR